MLSALLEQRYHGKIQLTNADAIHATHIPHIILFHGFHKHAAKLRQRIDILYEVALEYGTRINFAIADYADLPEVLQYNAAWMDQLLTYCDPGYLYAVDVAQRFYHFNGILNCNTLKEYCQLLLAGKLYRTEPISLAPADGANSLVQSVVADNFKKLVEQCGSDVLLVCYADGCQFSKKLMPVLEELGQRLEDVDDIALMKINIELNYLPIYYNITAYPTIVYVRKDEKRNVIEYPEGPRTLKNLIRFVAKNATTELTNYGRRGNMKS